MRGRNEDQLIPLDRFRRSAQFDSALHRADAGQHDRSFERRKFFPGRGSETGDRSALWRSDSGAGLSTPTVPPLTIKFPGRDQRIGFIGAMTNLHFCESCNKLRLTCDGKLRPCLGSYLEFDIMKPLRAGASDEELRQFFLDVVERKPEQHDFRNNYQPDRKMIAIGG